MSIRVVTVNTGTGFRSTVVGINSYEREVSTKSVTLIDGEYQDDLFIGLTLSELQRYFVIKHQGAANDLTTDNSINLNAETGTLTWSTPYNGEAFIINFTYSQ